MEHFMKTLFSIESPENFRTQNHVARKLRRKESKWAIHYYMREERMRGRREMTLLMGGVEPSPRKTSSFLLSLFAWLSLFSMQITCWSLGRMAACSVPERKPKNLSKSGCQSSAGCQTIRDVATLSSSNSPETVIIPLGIGFFIFSCCYWLWCNITRL